jgi:DNA invertase Pin-like site-specific DNA recombinase
MIFAYARVSAHDQNIDRQIQAIQEYAKNKNIIINRFFEEKASGKDFERQEYQSLKFILRHGDIIIITELDRLGRNMSQIKNEWQSLQKIGIDIIVIENELLNTAEKTDLEKSLISNIVFELLAYLAEKERVKIKQRQSEGIAIAKLKGKYKGRKPINRKNFKEIYDFWKIGSISGVKAANLLDMSKTSFYRKAKESEKNI